MYTKLSSIALSVPTRALVLAAVYSGAAFADVPANTATVPAPGPPPYPAERTDGYATPSTSVHTAPPVPPPNGSPTLAPPGAPKTGAPTTERAPSDAARFRDAHLDRVVIVPTAETHPEGTLYFSSNELVVLQGGYAVSDRTQVTLTLTPPVNEDLIFFADASIKTVLVREDRFRLAAIGSVSGIAGLDEGNFFLGRVSATAQFCFDEPCRSSLSLANSTLLGGPATINYSGLGLIWRVSTAFAFLLEANGILPLSRDVGPFNGLAMGPGGRLSWANFGVDLAFLWAVDAEVDDDSAPPVVPWLALTYRFLP